MFVPIDLVQFELLGVNIRANESFERKDARTSGGAVDVTLSIDEHLQDSCHWRLTLDIAFRPNKGTDAPAPAIPYDVNITARGEFTFPADAKEDDIQHTLRLNGASIVYGLMRGTVAQITAQSIKGQLLLPTFNFVALESKRQKELKNATEATEASAPPGGNTDMKEE